MDALVEMNDFAAFLMECREYKRALEIWNYCLTHVPQNQHSSIDTEIMKKHKDVMKSCSANHHRRPVNNGSANKVFVYRNPLRLTESELSRSHVDPEVAMSSNFIFNIALCHHLIALDTFVQQPPRSDTDLLRHKHCIKRLRGALKLYELGFHLHSKKGLEGMSMNYALALINNCANIYETLGSTGKAQRFYHHMLSSLMMMIDGGEAEKVDELEGYLRNASRLILGGKNVAAAA
ncbi:hypothetical protein IV203_021843 [Nitzschia inconspicua]|uniref:Uncharacterized protein n=1 Tax=Nitzschia inconspicua TaxID=303405 RepID=A0A9K3K6Z2_9STRA|nr:hypothetical protein IV203_033451 [Nitzschia inconspicua]KAG7343835.1 hypothetical protein IV203_021843 [Nitzschia inconspicua]